MCLSSGTVAVLKHYRLPGYFTFIADVSQPYYDICFPWKVMHIHLLLHILCLTKKNNNKINYFSWPTHSYKIRRHMWSICFCEFEGSQWIWQHVFSSNMAVHRAQLPGNNYLGHARSVSSTICPLFKQISPGCPQPSITSQVQMVT